MAHRRLLRRDGRLSDALRLRALVEGLFGDGLVAHELRGAPEIAFREGEIGARLREIGLGLVEGGLERPLVDGEQKIALLHHLAVGEIHPIEIAGHARADFHRVDRNEAADILVLIDDDAPDRMGDRHGRRRRRASLLPALSAARDGERERKNGEARLGSLQGLDGL